MSRSHYRDLGYAAASALLILALPGTSQAKSKPRQMRNSFLPPAPRPVLHEEVVISEPPASGLYAKEQPNLLPPSFTRPRGTEVESRLRRAEEFYAAGQRAYQHGNQAEARTQFDRAVDVLLRATENILDRQRLEHRLDQMIENIYRYDVNGLGSGEDPNKVVYDKSPKDDGMLEMTFPLDPRLKSKVKEELAATSSQLPLEENDAVLSYIHYFSTDRGHKTLTYGMKRSGWYRPMIQRVLQEEGVPQELIYLAQLESGFFPRAVSRKACVGMWQFAAFRGKEYGLNQTPWIDERRDPEKSTRAAAKHLHDLYRQFGDWYLAMAAYNCGPACVDRAVQRTGYADFWKLRDVGALPKETTNYVPAIVAITIMAKNGKDYGLENFEFEPAIEYETAKIQSPTNLALIADAVDRPVSEIKDLNPALLRGTAPEGYELRVPKGTALTLMAAIESIPAAQRASGRIHRVEEGESLASIAKRYHAAPAMIAKANQNLSDAPSPGDILVVPSAYQETVARQEKPRMAIAHGRTSPARPAATTRPATYHRMPAKVLDKKATVKTASLD